MFFAGLGDPDAVTLKEQINIADGLKEKFQRKKKDQARADAALRKQ